jgi:hypothetical protein
VLEHVFMRTADGATGELLCEVRWFYRPEDTSDGRQSDDGRDEVFESQHRDVNDVRSVLGRCTVLTEFEYGRYRKKRARQALAGATDPPANPVFFCRWGYDPARGRVQALSSSLSAFAPLAQ